MHYLLELIYRKHRGGGPTWRRWHRTFRKTIYKLIGNDRKWIKSKSGFTFCIMKTKYSTSGTIWANAIFRFQYGTKETLSPCQENLFKLNVIIFTTSSWGSIWWMFPLMLPGITFLVWWCSENQAGNDQADLHQTSCKWRENEPMWTKNKPPAMDLNLTTHPFSH